MGYAALSESPHKGIFMLRVITLTGLLQLICACSPAQPPAPPLVAIAMHRVALAQPVTAGAPAPTSVSARGSWPDSKTLKWASKPLLPFVMRPPIS